jgi:uncharacterized protein (TIGR02271 family)
MTVHSADGEKLGKVVRVLDDRFEIEKGFLFTKDYVAGFHEIATIGGEDIRLNVTSHHIREGLVADSGYGEEAGRSEGEMAAGRSEYREEVRVPLTEERLDVQKTAERAGEVRIRKDVVTEQKSVTVPVRKEEVRVERMPVPERAGGAMAGEDAFRNEEIVVPVVEERVEVRKTPVVREEVRVTKDVSEEQRRVNETVRREEAEVEEEPRLVQREGEPGIHAGSRKMNENDPDSII